MADAKQVRERRNQLRHPPYTKPELVANIFSRYVVGWMLGHTENATSATGLIRTTCENQQIQREQLTIHADRGAAMRSKTLA